MFVDSENGGGGGPEEDDGDGFVRHAWIYALVLGGGMYVSLAVMIWHDMRLLRTCTQGCEYWAGITMAHQGPEALFFSCILFFPAFVLFWLSRWFANPS